MDAIDRMFRLRLAGVGVRDADGGQEPRTRVSRRSGRHRLAVTLLATDLEEAMP